MLKVAERFTAVLLVAAIALSPSIAVGLSMTHSKYTELDIENDCVWDSLDHLSEEEREEVLGNSATCTGLPDNLLGNIPVHFSEYDLRQYVAFGDVGPDDRTPGGFSEFNRINKKIEWRMLNARPFATIVRWFIENINPNTGATNKLLEGQVLVVSKISTPFSPGSCPVAYVDARANMLANKLARGAADKLLGNEFKCGIDRPVFVGKRGPLSGNPIDLGN